MTFTIVKEGSGNYVEVGKEVKMNCSAVGFPSPKIVISTRENSKVLEIQSSMDPITFSLSNVRPSDTKTYVCSATNAAGASFKEEQIVVTCKLIFLIRCRTKSSRKSFTASSFIRR